MSNKKSFLDRVVETFSGQKKKEKPHTKKRKLALESLEVREMLSAVGFHGVQDAYEGGQAGYVRIERTDTIGDLAVHYELDYKNTGEYYSSNPEGHAKNGSDFHWLPGTNDWQNCGVVTFLDGQQYVDIAITPINDNWIEGNEQITLRLTDPGNCYYCYGQMATYSIDPNNSTATVNIIDDETPIYVWVDSAQSAVEGGQNGYIRLGRDDTSAALTVNYMLDSRNGGDYYSSSPAGWAKNGTDFQRLSGTNDYSNYGTITFAAGQEYVDIAIVAINDIYIEGNENVKVTLTETGYDGCGYGAAGKTYFVDSTRKEANVLIVDDEPETTVWIDSTQNGTEGSQNGYFRLKRNDATRALTVHYELDYRNGSYCYDNYEGWAKNGVDFQRLPGTNDYENYGTITFAIGQEYVDIPIIVNDDSLTEGTENVKITLRQYSYYDYCSPGVTYFLDTEKSSATLSILDNEAPVTVWIDSTQNAVENGQAGYFRIKRSTTSGSMTVWYDLNPNNNSGSTPAGWAKNNTDFNWLSNTNGSNNHGWVTFQNGQDYVDIVVTPKNDAWIEGTEIVEVTLSNLKGDGGGERFAIDPDRATAQVSILDDEIPITVSIESVQNAAEGGSNGYFRLYRDVTAGSLTVWFSLDEKNGGNKANTLGWGTNGLDFNYLPGTSWSNNRGSVTFAAGQAYVDIPITVVDDARMEGLESVRIQLEPNTAGATYLIDEQSREATLTIADNESVVNVWIHDSANGTEGGSNGSVTFKRDVTTTSLTVYYQIDSKNSGYYDSNYAGWAKNGTDFQWLPGTNEYENFGSFTFAAGQDTFTLPINVIDDNWLETTEVLGFTLLQVHPYYSYGEDSDIVYLINPETSTTEISVFDNEIPVTVWMEKIRDGEEGAENGLVRFYRDDTTKALTVYYQMDYRNGGDCYSNYEGWAKNGVDFQRLPGSDYYYNYGSVTFAAGQSSIDIPIIVVDDSYAEGMEQLQLTLTQSQGCYYGCQPGVTYLLDTERNSTTVQIFDNDEEINVWIDSTQNAVEGGQAGYVRLKRDVTTKALTVHYQLDYRNSGCYSDNYGGWAKNGTDFNWLPGTNGYDNYGYVTFAAGQEYVDIVITPINDAWIEGNEQIQITLSLTDGCYYGCNNGGANYFLNDNAKTATIEIIDDEIPVTVWVDSTQDATENGQNGYVRLRRDETTNSLTVYYQLDYRNSGYCYDNYQGWAKNGTDFNWLPGTNDWYNYGSITFAAGQEYVDIVITPIDDSVIEGTEQIRLTLSQTSGCYSGCGSGGVTFHLDNSRKTADLSIIDNDVDTTVWIDSSQDGTEGGQAGYVRLRRDTFDSALTVWFDIHTNNRGNANTSGWAKNGIDFELLSGTTSSSTRGSITFAAGQEYVDIPITAIDDDLVEGDEMIQITLCRPDSSVAYDIDSERNTTTVTIRDNDATAKVWIDSKQNVTEGAEPGYVRLCRDVTSNALTVYYTVERPFQGCSYCYYSVETHAKNGIDFQYLPGTSQSNSRGSVTFAAGQEYVDIPITAIDDLLVEGTEGFVVRLADTQAPNGQLIPYYVDENARSVTVLVHDNDLTPEVRIETIRNATEGGEPGYFRIYRNDASRALTIKYSVDTSRSDRATNGTDYEYLEGSYSWNRHEGEITFAAGQEYVDLFVSAIDDLRVEGTETVTITIRDGKVDPYYGCESSDGLLANVYRADPAAQSATLLLVDNDLAPEVWIDSKQDATEGGAAGYVRIRRSDATRALTVAYTVERLSNGGCYYSSDAHAQNGIDIQYLPGTAQGNNRGSITFAAGQEYVDIPVTAIDDLLVEGTENFILKLADSSTGGDQLNIYTVDESNRAVTVLVHDNDIAPTVWIGETQNATENGEAGYFRICRNDMNRALTIRYYVDTSLSNRATQGSDYEYLTGTYTWNRNEGEISFAAGQAYVDIPVVTINDSLSEGTETVTITIRDNSQNSSGCMGGDADLVNLYHADQARQTATILLVDDDSTPSVNEMTIWIDSFIHVVEGGADGKFILKRNGTDGPLEVRYSMGGSAQNDTDYEYLQGTVVFAAGSDTAEIIVRPKDDHLVEGTETVTLKLENNGTKYDVDEEKRSATLLLSDNDVAPLVWIETVTGATEGGASGKFIVKRSDTANPLTVSISMTGSAVNGTDYERINSSITFAVGQDSYEIVLQPKDDHTVEGDETVVLTLNKSSNSLPSYTLADDRATAVMILHDNDVAPSVWIDSVVHAVEGVQNGKFIVKRTDTTDSLTIRYSLGGTAGNGGDYENLNGYITFAAGSDTVEIVIQPKDDHVVEGTETVVLTLETNGNGYRIDETLRKSTLLLQDNDIAPQVWIDSFVNTAEGGENGKFVVKRSDTAGPLTLRISLTGTASNGTDYERVNEWITFAAGQDTYEIVIQPKDDHAVEAAETVILSLCDSPDGIPQYQTVKDLCTATLVILDNDAAAVTPTTAPVVWLESSTDATEGVSDGKFVLKRDNTEFALTVHYTVGGTADSESDYQSLSGYVTFAAGSDTAEVLIQPKDDLQIEADKTVILRLETYGNGYTLDGLKRTSVLTIHDNDLAPTVWVESTVDTVEGSPSPGKFVLKRSDTATALTVRYTMSGTAGNNGDYDHLNGYVTFAAGQDTVEVFVRTKDDLDVEIAETVILKLETNGNIYTLDEARRSASLTIADNDIAPTVWIDTIEDAVEGVRDGRFVLKRSDTASALTVGYTVGGSASTSTDYESLSGSVTFAAGSDTAVIVVRPKDDLVVESGKNVIVTLSSPTVKNNVAQYVLDTTRSTGTLGIADNDIVSTVWIESSENATEGGNNGKFVLMRDDVSTALTVRYTLSGKAKNNEDYEHLNGYVTFAAGQNMMEIVVRTKDDTVFEGDETVTLKLETNGNGYVLDETKRTASLTIVDNDESPTVWIDSVVYGLEGGHNARIILKRDAFRNELVVGYAIDHTLTTASLNNDFNIEGFNSSNNRGQVTFEEGSDTVEIIISIIDDEIVEIQESLTIRLSAPTVSSGVAQYQLDDSRRETTLFIDDNDTAPKVWIDSFREGAEGGQYGYFRLKRDNVLNAVAVSYIVSGSAHHGNDISRLTGQVTFARGQEYVEIPIYAIDDEIVEVDEVVTLQLTPTKVSNVNQYELEGSAEHPLSESIIIRDNDIAPLIWIDSTGNGQEGAQNGYFRLRRDNVQNSVRVNYTIAGSAGNNGDYHYINSYVTFARGQEHIDIPINVIDDEIVELTETVFVTLQPRQVDHVDQYFLDESQVYPFAATVYIADNDIAPTVWIEEIRNAEESGQSGYFKLRRDNTQNSVTVYFNLEGTAGNNSDYSYVASHVTFAHGQDTVLIPIYAIDDTKVELNEIVAITLTPYRIGTVEQYILDGSEDRPFIGRLTITDNDVPPVVWIDAVQAGTEGGEDGYFRLRRDNTQNPVTVYYTIGGTASNGGDYNYRSSNVTFAAGQSSIDIPIIIVDDEIVEWNETVTITLNPRIEDRADQYILDGSEARPLTATIALQDNDTAPNIWIETTQEGTEGGRDGYFRLRRDNIQNSVTVYYDISGAAYNGGDYHGIPGTVTFAKGQDYIDIPIYVVNDQIVEVTETVTITLREYKNNNVHQYIIGEDAEKPFTATINIFDDDPAPQVWVEKIQDGAEGGANGQFRLWRDNTQNEVTVYYSIGGTAANHSDYSGIYTSVTFYRGQNYVDIHVNVIDDIFVEPEETVVLTLTPRKIDNVDQYILNDSEERPTSATVTITDNDVPSNVWIQGIRNGEEGMQDGLFRIYRDNTNSALRVYFTISGTAHHGSDYHYINSYVDFIQGQIYVDVPINVIDDRIIEPDETVSITLQSYRENSVDQYTLNADPEKPASTTIVIKDNDSAPKVWINSLQDGIEGTQDGMFRIYRENSNGTLTVYYGVGGTASNGSDYSYIYSSVTFQDGQTFIDIPIVVVDDAIAETEETVTLTLSPYQIENVEQYEIVGSGEKPSSATVVIYDNDVTSRVWIEQSRNGTEGAQNGYFRIYREDNRGQMIVHYRMSGSAGNGSDYNSVSSSVRFDDGVSYVDVPINVVDDELVELTEDVTITLTSNTVNGVEQYILVGTDLYPSTATISIFENDIAPNVWIDSVNNGAEIEGGRNGYFRLKRDNTQNRVTVYFGITGTARNGSDYSSISSHVTFAAGQEYVDIPIAVVDDMIVEALESVSIVLQPYTYNNIDQYVVAGTADKPSSATITISDNDIAPNVWIEEVRNGTEGGQNGYFRLRRDNTQNEVRVNFTIGGTASNGSDYQGISSYITFAQGQNTVDIPIYVFDDIIVEITETVVISLQNRLVDDVEQYHINSSPDKPSTATIQIFDNDIAPNVWIDAQRNGQEGGQHGFIRIRRDNVANSLTIHYNLGGTASNGSDYVGISSSSAVFAEGQAYIDIPVNVINDTIVENTESVTFTLLERFDNGVCQYNIVASDEKPSSVTILIFDNDTAPNVWIESKRDAYESGQNGFFTIKRDNTENPLTIKVAIGGTASNGYDYSHVSTSYTFAQGQNTLAIPVNVIDDTIAEFPENVTLTILENSISGVLQYIIGHDETKPNFAEITIHDNEIMSNVWIESVRNGKEGGEDGLFRIWRDNTAQELKVYFDIAGSATNGTDYERLPNFVTLKAGEAYVDLPINIITDSLVESDENVVITLRQSTSIHDHSYILDGDSERPSTAVVLIEDTPPTVSIHSIVHAIEGLRNGYLRLERNFTDTSCTVQYDFSGTAEMMKDYSSLTGTVTFARGQKYVDIVINARDDKKIEDTETVVLTINDQSSNYVVTGTNSAVVLIYDRSTVSTISVTTVSDSYGNQSFRFTRDVSSLACDVYFRVSPESTAIAGVDYEQLAGTAIESGLGLVHFNAGQSIVDVPVYSLDFFADGSKFIKLELVTDRNSDYIVKNGVAVLSLLPPVVLPQANRDQYRSQTGKSIIVDNKADGLLANDINKANKKALTQEQAQVVLVSGPVNGTLTLNDDGTFSYLGGNSGGVDSFSYKVVTPNGVESDVATVTLITPLRTGNNPLATLPANEIPEFPMNNGEISVGGQNFSLDPTQEFTPIVIGTYEIHNSVTTVEIEEDEEPESQSSPAGGWGGSGITPLNFLMASPAPTSSTGNPITTTTYTQTVDVVSVAYENGDWTYSEIVTWNNDTVNSEGTLGGGYTYVFMAWSLDGDKGFTYEMIADDNYDIDYTDTTPTETVDSYEWGSSSEYVYIGSWLTEGRGTDIRTVTSENNLDSDGDYSYEVEGGDVSGTLWETGYGYDFSYTNISLTKTGEVWSTTGFHIANSNGNASSGYSGSGTYYIEDSSSVGDEWNSVEIGGNIEESGESESDYRYNSTGTLGSNGWVMSGTGFSNSYDESSYLNDETGTYITDIYADSYTSKSQTDDTIHYLDQYSLDRKTNWTLQNGTWTATSGTETEKSYTEDDAKSETEGKYEEDDSDLDTRYEEYAESEILDDYELCRNLIAGAWVAVSGTARSKTYGRYYKDVKIASAEYERNIDGGTVEGVAGVIRRDLEEFDYDSRSTIVAGDWQLQSGNGYYRFGTEFGDYAEGEGEYTLNGTTGGQSWSYSGEITESWKDMAGGGGRTDYTVNDHQWEVKDEWDTELKTFEYEFTDEANGTKNGAVSVASNIGVRSQSIEFDVTSDGRGNQVQIYHTVPGVSVVSNVSSFSGVGNYEKEKRLTITDETEVKTKLDDAGNPKTVGTRNIAEIDSFYESFDGEKDLTFSASGTSHQGTLFAEKVIDDYFERYADYEWTFVHESDSTYREEYDSTVTEYQEKSLLQSLDFSADEYYFYGSEDSYSEIDNETKTSKTYEFVSQGGNPEHETVRDVTVTEETEKDHYSYYDFTRNVDFGDTHNQDRIREVTAEYIVSEEKTTTGESYMEETGTATKNSDGRWVAGSTSTTDLWDTETVDANGLRTYNVQYSGTGAYPAPEHRYYYCFSLVEWDITDDYKDTYEYTLTTDSRNNSNPELQNHVTGTMTSDGQATSFHCWDTYWNGYPEPQDDYDETINTAGFYGSGYSYSRTTHSLPGLGNNHRVLTPTQAVTMTDNYATYAGLNLPGCHLTVGAENFSSFASYFGKYGFEALADADYDEIVEKLAGTSLSSGHSSGGYWSLAEEIKGTGNKDGAVQAIKNALVPALRAVQKTEVTSNQSGDTPGNTIIEHIWEQYTANVSFTENEEGTGIIATVAIYMNTWTSTQVGLSPIIDGQPRRKFIANFTMEVDNDGMASESVLASARYLVELLKTNPPKQHLGVIHITEGMTKLEVRQAFKRVTGMTAIEDMFIELPQAEMRQLVKDKLDKLLDDAGMIRVKNNIDFTWFYNVSGMDKVYENLMSTLCDRRLSFSYNSSYLTLMSADGLYHPWVNTIFYDDSTSDVTYVHELWHAYNDLNLDNSLSRRDDEGVAGTIQYFLLIYSQKIYNTYSGILESIRDGDDDKLERYVSAWNDEHMQDKDKTGVISLLRGGHNDGPLEMSDFINAKKMIGLDLSQKFLEMIEIHINSSHDREDGKIIVPANASF